MDLVDYDTKPVTLPRGPLTANERSSFNLEVEKHSVFVYIGSDLVDAKLGPTLEAQLDSRIIVAYTKKCRTMRDMCALSFVDGNTFSVHESKLPTYLAQSNAARASIGLPALKLIR